MLRSRSLLLTGLLALLVPVAGAAPAIAQIDPATPVNGATPVAGPVEFVWQTEGGPDLPLDQPAALALDSQGNLWVADGKNSRFQIFAPDGTFLEAWGTTGSGDGQFNFVRTGGDGIGGVAFDAAGAIYVVDTGNRRVQKFDPNRQFVTAWGSEGSGDGQFRDPFGIALGRGSSGRGRVYVIDDRRDDVQVFDANGGFLFTFGGPGSGDGQLHDTGLIAVASDGDLWIADWGNYRIQRFAPDGTFLAAWGRLGVGEGEFLGPLGVAVDGQGRVFVTDSNDQRVQVFDREGRFLAAWGGSGSGEGEFGQPSGIVVDGAGHVYVSDMFDDRV